jgi:hypothetical protein
MSPSVIELPDDRVNEDTLVSVFSDSDVDWKVKPARMVTCLNCGRQYDAMSWFNTDVAIVLICPCGQTFNLAS